MRWVAALLLLAVALAVQPGVAWAAGRVALVVGVSTYANVASLNNPARDAARVAEALRAADFDVTTLTLPQQVTRASLVSALAKFRARADNAEAAVIYFAGHGVEVDGSNWLLPADVAAESPDDLEGTAIRASFAVNAVRGASKIRLVILDACRNNPFERTRGWAAGKRAIGTRGLGREADRADNVVLLLATQPGTTANDGNGAANSPFALALATSLGTDGMQIAALPATVARQMRQLTGVDQRPDQQGIFDEPSWTFHGGGGSATVAGNGATVAGPRPAVVNLATQPVAGANPNAPALVRECDRLAGSEYSVNRPVDAPFIALEDILPALAVPACLAALDAAPTNIRLYNQLGRAFSKKQDYSEARRWFEQGAAKDNADAMTNLGNLYYSASGVAQDYAEARRWWEQAAAKGQSVAMRSLGILYSSGQGAEKNFIEARLWFEKAAALNNYDAMSNLGYLYDKGLGVAQDYAQARSWYDQAAAKGNTNAMIMLGVLYFEGKGVTKDYTQTRQWYERAAANGNADAMFYLGALYFSGYGVTKDTVEARRWFEKAAEKGSDVAKKWLAANPR